MKSSGDTESRAIERLALTKRVSSAAPALLFGSVALELAYPELLDHAPPDIDFLVPLSSVAPIITAIDHTWTSWDEPVVAAKLTGRFYVRGRHATRPTIDLTYESPLSWIDAWARRVEVEGISVASPRDLATVYSVRGKPGDDERARRLRTVRI